MKDFYDTIKKRISPFYSEIFRVVGIERKINNYCGCLDYNLITSANTFLKDNKITWKDVANDLYLNRPGSPSPVIPSNYTIPLTTSSISPDNESITSRRFQLYIISKTENKTLNLNSGEAELYKKELIIFLLCYNII